MGKRERHIPTMRFPSPRGEVLVRAASSERCFWLCCRLPSTASGRKGSTDHRRDSRHSIAAAMPATTHAIPLAQTGTGYPFTVTAQPITARHNCSSEIADSSTIAKVVNGFMASSRDGGTAIPRSAGPGPRG